MSDDKSYEEILSRARIDLRLIRHPDHLKECAEEATTEVECEFAEGNGPLTPAEEQLFKQAVADRLVMKLTKRFHELRM